MSVCHNALSICYFYELSYIIEDMIICHLNARIKHEIRISAFKDEFVYFDKGACWILVVSAMLFNSILVIMHFAGTSSIGRFQLKITYFCSIDSISSTHVAL